MNQEQKGRPKRNPPMRIPMDFDTAIDGLLAVNPKEPAKPTDEDYERAQGKRKKPAKKK